MARRGASSLGTLTPFGGGGVDFSAFDIIDTSREAALAFRKVQIAWEDGQATNDEYLAALETYVNALALNTTERLSAEQRLRETKYRFARDVVVRSIENDEATLADLVAFDAQHISGMNPASQGYAEGLNLLRSSQSAWFSEQEAEQVELYNDGKITSATLQRWYRDQLTDDLWTNNPDLRDRIVDRVDELDDRIQDERDQQMVADYSDGRVSGSAFIAYATAALARYAPGTSEYSQWKDRLQAASDAEKETGLLYRYGLSQEYIQLQMFVANNQGPAGGTSTSTSQRTVLGADGHWHTISQTTTKATAPSAAEQAAWRQRQVEIASAKSRMAEISQQLSGTGGFVNSQSVLAYYKQRQTRFVKGTVDWYALQEKIDGVNDRLRQEQVWTQQGYKVGYSSAVAGAARASGGGGAGAGASPGASSGAARPSSAADIDRFMRALGQQESGGRYDARNSVDGGHYGKYQIKLSNWPGWAQKYLGNASAPMTPENQEKVAKGKILDLYKWLGSWEAVAHWWLNGGSDKAWHNNPSAWNAYGSRYVNNVMAGMGRAPVAGGTGRTSAGSAGATGGSTRAGGGVPSSGRLPAGAYSATDVLTGQTTTSPVKGGRPTKGATITVAQVQPGGFPVNLSSQAFEDFYNGYRNAWEDGAEVFIDPGSGVSYYIGTNPDQRITRMAELDNMRIELFTVQADDYAGTVGGVSAADKRRGAIEDAALHAYMILDFDAAGAVDPSKRRANAPVASATNALGAAISLLDGVTAGITDEYRLAQEAWKRGDVTAAYQHYQNAERMVDQGIGPIEEIVARRIQQVAGKTGLTPDQAGVDETFKGDWKRLQDHEDELAKLQEKAASDFGSEMERILLDPKTGQPIVDLVGNQPQVRLPPGYAALVTFNDAGEPVVDYQRIPAGEYVDPAGRVSQTMDGYVAVQAIRAGATVLDANVNVMVKYRTGRVGYIVGPGGQMLPILGKIIDGPKGELWVENPLDPGKWSNKMLVIDGGDKIEVTAGTTAGTQSYGWLDSASGMRITMAFNEKTGLYDLYGQQKGPLGELGDLTPLGDLGGNPSLREFIDRLGLKPRTTGDPFSYTNGAVLGMTTDQYRQWASAGITLARQQRDVVLTTPGGHRLGLSATGSKVAGRVHINQPYDPLSRDKWWEEGGSKVDLFSGDQNARDRWYLDQQAKTDKLTIEHEDQLRRVGELPPIPSVSAPLQTQRIAPPPRPAPTTVQQQQGAGRTGTSGTPLSKTGSGAKASGPAAKPAPKPPPPIINPLKNTPV